MTTTQPELVCLGEPMVEFNQQPDGGYLYGHGGDTSNCAVAAARQGGRVGYLTALGDDPFGRTLRALWAAEGIDASRVHTHATAPTGIYFVHHGPSGHEFSYRRSGSAASLMRAEDLPADYIAGAKVLHVSGISQGISDSAADTVFAAIEIARANATLVSYDTNLRLKLWPLERARAVIHAAMSHCDIALPGLEDARQLTGLEEPGAIVDFYLHLGAKVVALTLGEQGALVATAVERRVVPSTPVQAVDATGAGDTFDGAFLAYYLECSDPFLAARHAVVAAALATTGYGAVEPMPRRDAVESVLAKL